MPRLLFVFTSASKALKDTPTGWYLPEAAHPYYTLAPHVDIDFAAPSGPNPPIDEYSVKNFKDEQGSKFLQDPTVKSKLTDAKKLAEVRTDDYDGVYYVGGHGPVIDLATDADNIKLANSFWEAGKIVSAVCHGTAALVGVTDSNGKSIFAGRSFTGFSDAEEAAAGSVDILPFLLETEIKKLGGKYEKARELWGVKVTVDGKLITGQNPTSSKAIGEALLKALQ